MVTLILHSEVHSHIRHLALHRIDELRDKGDRSVCGHLSNHNHGIQRVLGNIDIITNKQVVANVCRDGTTVVVHCSDKSREPHPCADEALLLLLLFAYDLQLRSNSVLLLLFRHDFPPICAQATQSGA